MLGADYDEDRFKTRVIAFIYNKEDYEGELKAVQAAARFSARRIGLRFALVTDVHIIKKYRETTSWFPSEAYSTIILKRYDGEISHLDITQATLNT